MRLSHLNKAINDIHSHVSSLMKVSSKYGKKMGTMGTTPWNSAQGAAFARKTAEMMAKNPGNVDSMLSRIFNKARGAGMSSDHMDRFNTVADRIKERASRAGPDSDLSKINLF